MSEIANPFDCIIDGAGGQNLNTYIRQCRPGGKIVVYGATAGRCDRLNLHWLFLKNIDLCGTSMGSSHEFGQMVEFVRQHRIRPVVDRVFDFKDFALAFDRMRDKAQFGKLVLKIVHTGLRAKL